MGRVMLGRLNEFYRDLEICRDTACHIRPRLGNPKFLKRLQHHVRFVLRILIYREMASCYTHRGCADWFSALDATRRVSNYNDILARKRPARVGGGTIDGELRKVIPFLRIASERPKQGRTRRG